MNSRTARLLLALLVAGCNLPLPDPAALEAPTDGGADAGGWRWQAVPLAQPNTLHGLWGSSDSDVWAVGNGGLILHHDGKSWSSVPSPTKNDLNAVWGAGQDVWAVGDAGTVLRRTGGGSWTDQGQLVPQDLNGVWTDGAELWAAGSAATLVHNNSTASAEGNDDLQAVWGSSPADIWAVGGNGAMLHHDGTSWSPLPAVTSRTIFGVWGRSATDIFAAAAGGAVLRYDGSAWSRTDVDAGVSFRALAGGAGPSGALWAVGDRGGDGVIYGLEAGGGGWSLAGTYPGAILHAVWVAPSGEAWAVGGGTGEALRYGP
jgi:hypothetical protein